MKRPVHTGIHRWGAPDDGLRYCEVCGIAQAAAEGFYVCSGVRGVLGRLIAPSDLTAGVAPDQPTELADPTPVRAAPRAAHPGPSRPGKGRRERTPDEWKAGVPFGHTGHHVVYQQHVRAAGGDVWDLRNRLILADDRHAAHHSGIRQLALAELPGSAYVFAAYTLGPNKAYNFLQRHYTGVDVRLDALLALHDEPVAA